MRGIIQHTAAKCIKASAQVAGRMGKGLHELAYSLTLDPSEEIRGALADVSTKSWNELQSLDKLVAESMPDGIEAEVADAQVYARGNEASYRSEAVELPLNYRDSGTKAADDDEDAEVSYAFCPDIAWTEARQEYEHEVEKRVEANILKMDFMPVYSSSEMAERVKNYGISIGSLSFVLYDIKQLNK